MVCGEHRVQGGTSQQMARALPYLGAMILPLLIMKLGRGRVGMSRVVARKRCVRKQEAGLAQRVVVARLHAARASNSLDRYDGVHEDQGPGDEDPAHLDEGERHCLASPPRMLSHRHTPSP